VSYQVAVSYLRLNAQTDHVTLWADALPESAAQVRDGVLAVVDELIANGPTDEEIRTEVELIQKTMDQPDRTRVQGELAHELLGAANPPLEDMLIELRQSSPAELAKELEGAIQTGLMIVPEGLAVSNRFHAIPQWSEERLAGQTHTLRGSASGRPTRLIVAPAGITMVIDATRFVTIRYDQCAALLTWTDGSRTLMASDGSRIQIRPADWSQGEAAVQEIDRQIPKDRVVPFGDRPKPDPAALVKPESTSVKIVHLILGGFVAMYLILMLSSLRWVVTGNEVRDNAGAAIVYGFLAIVFALPLYRPYIREFLANRRRTRRAN
jgi:hypothetical protein